MKWRRAPMLGGLLAVLATEGAYAGPASTDNQIRRQIVQQSVADYRARGHPCACPYSLTRKGSPCGARSAYKRPGGEHPLCYPSDVTDQMISDWKRQHAEEGHAQP
ncbi:MAG: hypothetical protein JO166_07440 [Deltaproteobacteria bacterium]|nr:hypothetical protein [Deltaproteobacteria bacterium]